MSLAVEINRAARIKVSVIVPASVNFEKNRWLMLELAIEMMAKPGSRCYDCLSSVA